VTEQYKFVEPQYPYAEQHCPSYFPPEHVYPFFVLPQVPSTDDGLLMHTVEFAEYSLWHPAPQ
jgi:hypothetical protein